MFRLLYPVYVNLHLKYYIQTASPYFKYEDLLERVQRQRNKLVKDLSVLSYEDRQRRFNLFQLSLHVTR